MIIKYLFLLSCVIIISCESSNKYSVSRVVDGNSIELTNGTVIELAGVEKNQTNIKILNHYATGEIELYDLYGNEINKISSEKEILVVYNNDGDCLNDLVQKVTGISNDTLITPLAPVEEQRKTIVKMHPENGVYTIPVRVNDLEMYFIFDTGASLISISTQEVERLHAEGTLTDSDILDKGWFSNANGDVSEGQIINLKFVQIGDRILSNVKACVTSGQNVPLLFGQTALKKFGKVTIDYNNEELIFE